MHQTADKNLRLNAFELRYSADQFTAFQQPLPNPDDLEELKARVKADWFIYWRGGIAWGLPLMPNPTIGFGAPTTLTTQSYEGLSLLGARTSAQLQDFLPAYVSLPGHHRGFRFVARNAELVGQITQGWRTTPPLLREFGIRPRFTVETRLIELQNQALRATLIVDIAMRWDIQASLEALAGAGVELAGLYVVRRNPLPGQRGLLGQIASIQSGKVRFDESYQEAVSADTQDVKLEPTKQSFARCIDILLGAQSDAFWKQYDVLESNYRGGVGYDACLQRLSKTLTKPKGIFLGPDISVAVGDQVDVGQLKRPVPVSYCFDPGKTKQNIYSWNGLSEYGPYTRDSFPRQAPKLLLVCPVEAQNRVEQAVLKFRDGIPGSVYAKGFARMFHLVNLTIETCPIPSVRASASDIATTYASTVEKQLQRRSDYDAALVIVADQFSHLPDTENPYLYAKAVLLTNGIPVQEAKLSTITRADLSLCYVFQNISVALYAKMGGVPWTVNQDQTVNDEVVIGMGLVETSGSRFQSKQRIVGITTVFRATETTCSPMWPRSVCLISIAINCVRPWLRC